MKINKIYISITILIVIIVAICFLMGYRIPEITKHRDWIFIPENNDSFFEVEKTDIKTDFVLSVPGNKGYILLLKDEDFILTTAITEKGRVIKKFPKTKDFYIDSLNQRFIFSKEIYKNGTLFTKELISYSFSDYQKKENLALNDYIIEETKAEFLNRKKISIKKIQNNEEEKNLDDAYVKDKSKESSFYKTLFPVTKVSVRYEAFDVEFYTDKNGELFTVEKTKGKTESIQEIWNSLYPLFPNYNKKMDAKRLTKEIFTYKEVEEPTIESNYIRSHFLSVSFGQNYIKYFQIRFGSNYFNFKYRDKTLNFPDQLNIPKTNNDTLAVIYDKALYRIYPKTNRKYK